MKKHFYSSILFSATFLLAGICTQGQQSFSNDSLCIFYPSGYDSTQMLPSFAIQQEPVVQSGIPAGWKLTSVFYKNTSSQNCAVINCGSNTDFYGTGEVIGNLKRNNTSITLWNTDNYKYTTDNGKRLYQSHPWVMGVRDDGSAFGIIADNTWKMSIDITDTSVVFTSLDGPSFRVFIFEGRTPQDIVQKLGTLTGRIKLPPLWSLGYHQCRYSYMSDSEVRSIADSFRSKQLPCDVIWMDIDYMDQYKIFTFSSSAFPDPAALNTYLHSKKFKTIWMIDPGVKQQSGYFVYDQGTSGNHWVQNSSLTPFVGTVWPGNCVFPDFTRPETRTWWSSLYYNFMSKGIDGVWNDMNEPSVFNGTGGTMPPTNIHRGGGGIPQGTHLRYHNVYGRLMVQASREGILQYNPSRRPFILSRSNFLGGQQYAATWTGDNMSSAAHMQLSVPMILTLGLSGQPVSGADVGGYSGNCTADLLSHWMALGTFYPFYRNHSEKGAARQEPWSFGTTTEQVCRIALQRRYRLLPYMYTLLQESASNGMPVMRPLFFADPTDKNLRAQQQAFLLGSNLLVIPKWATNVTMPSGTWRSISIVGEDSRNDPYQPNVLLKEGAILPLGQILQSTSDYTGDSLSLIVSLDKNDKAFGYVYIVSGEGFQYQEGNYIIKQFSAEPYGTDSIKVSITQNQGLLATDTSHYRVGLATENGIAYTNWTSDTAIYIPKYPSVYGGILRTIPGKIEVEDYDTGSDGNTYHDSEPANQGGKYRTDGVDIETCSEGGYSVGWIIPGEWLTYTVKVLYPGIYTLQARVATNVTGGKTFHVELDGINISGTINVPYTAGWQAWQTVTVYTPYLTTGVKVLRIVMDSNDFNINYLNFSLYSRNSCPGNNVSFVAAIPTTGNTYHWQVNTGTGYTNLLFSGALKDTLVLTGLSTAMYGNTYRCLITSNGITYYSKEYTLQFGNSWTGAVSTAWENPQNWSCEVLPDANTDVFIPTGKTNYPEISSTPSVRSLSADAGAKVTIKENYKLTITH